MKNYKLAFLMKIYLLKANIHIVCLISLFACLLPSGVLHAEGKANLKNLYILFDPSIAKEDRGIDKGLTLSLESDYLRELIASLSHKKMKFDHVIFRIAGLKNKKLEVYSRRQLRAIDPGEFATEIYLAGRELGVKKKIIKHGMSKSLGDFSNVLDKLGWKGAETLLLILSDVDFIGDVASSHGGVLNAAWLTNPRSPFVRFFLKKDNSFAKGSSVIVFTRTQLEMKHEQKRRAFLINLFDKAGVGMRVYYAGSMRNSVPIENSFAVDIVRMVQHKILNPLSIPVLKKVEITQILSEKGELTIRNYE